MKDTLNSFFFHQRNVCSWCQKGFFQKEIERINVDYFILKLGKNGIILIKRNTTKKFIARKIKSPDVTGAGDTVISVASLVSCIESDLKQLGFLANLAGGQVCEKVGG